jgi:peptide chain release factor 1
VTVAVIDHSTEIGSVSIPNYDLKIEWYSGTGAGGQYRNKHQNSCRITHLPTGTVAKSECRSRTNSLNEAMAEIQRRVDEQLQRQYNNTIAGDRKQQVGSGMRGDKIRTYRFQDDVVQDHLTGKRAKCSQILKGNIDQLWPKMI